MEGLVSEAEETTPSLPRPGTPFRQRIALTCAIIGCAGWVATVFLMGPYDDGEKLARFFQALVNVLIMAAFGGLSTILSVIALLLTTPAHGDSQTNVRKMGFYLSWLGLLLGSIILISQLPGALIHLD